MLLSEAENKRFDRFRDSHAKIYAECQKILGTLGTMATALATLPLIFFKDIFHEDVAKGETILTLILRQSGWVSGAFALSWLCLAFSIGAGLYFSRVYGVYLIGLYMYDDPSHFVNPPQKGAAASWALYREASAERANGLDNAGPSLRMVMNSLFTVAATAFTAGLMLMMLFALSYVKTTVAK